MISMNKLNTAGRSGRPAGRGGEPIVEQIPPFLVAKNLNPFIPQELRESSKPIIFRTAPVGSADGGEPSGLVGSGTGKATARSR